MDISLTARPRKLKRISTPGLKGMAYQQQLDICRDLEQREPALRRLRAEAGHRRDVEPDRRQADDRRNH